MSVHSSEHFVFSRVKHSRSVDWLHFQLYSPELGICCSVCTSVIACISSVSYTWMLSTSRLFLYWWSNILYHDNIQLQDPDQFRTFPTNLSRSRPASLVIDQLRSLPLSFTRYRPASHVTDQLHTLPLSFARHRPAPLVTIQLRSLSFSYRIARYQPSHDIQQLFYNIERTEIKIIIFWNSKIYWIKFAEFSLLSIFLCPLTQR